MKIDIKVRSLRVKKESYADLDGLPSYVKKRKKNLLEAIGVTTENLLKDEARRIGTFGTLERSIQHTVLHDLVIIFSDLEYSNIALETGRKDGKIPPVKAIEMWAVKKGLGAGAAWPIAKKIQKEGTNVYKNQAPKRVTRTVKVMDKKLSKLIKKHLFDG